VKVKPESREPFEEQKTPPPAFHPRTMNSIKDVIIHSHVYALYFFPLLFEAFFFHAYYDIIIQKARD